MPTGNINRNRNRNGNGEYNILHDNQMRQQNSGHLLPEQRLITVLQEIRNTVNQIRAWDEINLRGRHPDNVASDMIDAFSNQTR